MGTGDWNDGMNRVGERRQGRERLARLVPATRRSTASRRSRERARRRERAPTTGAQHADALRDALEREGWDGDWYRRGYFDDGTPLGSAPARRMPHRLDRAVLGVISGAADPARAARAMAAVDEHLVRRDERLVAAVHAAVRQDAARSRLHQGLSARHPRERRPVHARRDLVGHRASPSSATATRRRELFSHAQSDQPRATRATASQRYKVEPYVVARRCLFGAAACRARRLDLVHGLGRLDVSRRPRMAARLSHCTATC